MGRSLCLGNSFRTFGALIMFSARSHMSTPCEFIGRWHTLCPSQVLRECIHTLAGQAQGVLGWSVWD